MPLTVTFLTRVKLAVEDDIISIQDRFKLKFVHTSIRYVAEISETLDEVSVSTTFVQSRLVSVSTTTEFPSLDESRSRQPQNFPVSMSLGLDNHKISQSR